MSDTKTLAAHWPDMPDLPDGVDLFAEHPISGIPNVVSVVTLTPLQWNVLTYIQEYERRHTVDVCRNSEVQVAWGLPSRSATRYVLDGLESRGLVQQRWLCISGTAVRAVCSNKQATGLVGVSYE